MLEDYEGREREPLMKYANYTNVFAVKSRSDNMRVILNLDPSCNADLREKATNTIYAFVSYVYIALNLLSD